VEHSLSPGIHAAFARQTGQRLEYTRIDAPPHGFTAALRGFLAGGGKGLSITLPFKEEAFALCHELTPRAKKARAINTMSVHEDGTILGDNTDGAGLVRDLKHNHHFMLKGKRVLLLGAGGAARGPRKEMQSLAAHSRRRLRPWAPRCISLRKGPAPLGGLRSVCELALAFGATCSR
jgi:shikimate dehydrogenase